MTFIANSCNLPNSLGVLSEGPLSLCCDLALLTLLLLLLLDDAEEFVTLGLRLLGKHDFALNELSPSSHVQFLGLLHGELSLFLFFPAGSSLTFFEGTLGAKCINLALSVSSAFLQLTKTLDFKFFLLFLAASFLSICFFLGDALGVVTDDFQILFTLNAQFVLLAIQGDLVGYFDILQHAGVTVLLFFSSSEVSDLLLLNGLDHLGLLSLELFTLAKTDLFTLLNLFNDNSGTTTFGIDTKLFALVLSLQGLQTLDFHHQVKTFLFLAPLCLEDFVLIKLLVTDGDNLGVEGHLIHVFDIVVLLVQLLLRVGEQTLGTLILLQLDLSCWQFRGTGLVHGLHARLAGLGLSLLLSLLLLIDAFPLRGVFLANDNSCGPHASNVCLGDNSGLTRGIILLGGFAFDVGAHLSQVVIVHNRHV